MWRIASYVISILIFIIIIFLSHIDCNSSKISLIPRPVITISAVTKTSTIKILYANEPQKLSRGQTIQKSIVQPLKSSTKAIKNVKVVQPTKTKIASPIQSNQTVKNNSPPVGGTRYKVTAYDLSVASCGKSKSNPQYGLTRSGFNLAGLSWQTARTIASDPRLIPLGTKVYLAFESSYAKKFNGVYTVRDTGGAIKGRILDFYMGENATKECDTFGIQYASVTVY